MNRNSEEHFALNPTNLDMSRSRFDMSFDVKTTFNVGDIIPIGRPIEVLPGDTFSIDTSKVVRLQTLLKPVCDNLYLDTYFFFVPNRLVWDHWKEFMGENTASAWLPSTTYSIPQVTCQLGTATSGWPVGSIADYMGVPVYSNVDSINALPFRGYALICNEWFRSEALSDPLIVYKGDSLQTYSASALPLYQPLLGGTPYKAAKLFDYFTGALPAPQKGPDVGIPLSFGSDNFIPVQTFAANVPGSANGRKVGLKGFDGHTGSTDSSNYTLYLNGSSAPFDAMGQVLNNATTSNRIFDPSNLWANASGGIINGTINSLRLAFQIQKLYEKDARGGTRYIEILKSHFGVTSPDSRIQRPEYLGGNRIPIHVNQVINQGQQNVNTVIGDVYGQSLTTDVHSDFTHSFTEHGMIFCLAVARYQHSYQQGLHKMWTRENRLDFYWPVLANIGEQAIQKREIYNVPADEINIVTGAFGYQEAWAEYRYMPDMICGEMRSGISNTLDSWHFGDYYSSEPTLSDAWIREDKTNVDRTLAVTSSVSNQIFGDFYFDIKATRCMPVYSIPGLIDHH